MRVLAYDYKVKLEEGMAARRNAFAEHDGMTGSVCVDSMLRMPNVRADLLHEVIESINLQLELEIDHRKITALATSLATVLRDNPRLTAAFLEDGYPLIARFRQLFRNRRLP